MEIIEVTKVLYEHHDGELMPQAIYVVVDLKEGTLTAECDDGTHETRGQRAFRLPGYMYSPTRINEILASVCGLASEMEIAHDDDEDISDLKAQIRDICENAGLDDSVMEAQDFFAYEMGKKFDDDADEYWEGPENLARIRERFGVTSETDVTQLIGRLEQEALFSMGPISYVYNTREFAQKLIDSARE